MKLKCVCVCVCVCVCLSVCMCLYVCRARATLEEPFKSCRPPPTPLHSACVVVCSTDNLPEPLRTLRVCVCVCVHMNAYMML